MPTIREVLQGFFENNETNFVGYVTDEEGGAAETTALLKTLATQLDRALDENVRLPATFRAAGARLIFRDLVYRLRFFFKADHRYYKRHGFYDYPQKNWRERLQNLFLGAVTLVPSIRREFYRDARKQIVQPMDRILDRVE